MRHSGCCLETERKERGVSPLGLVTWKRAACAGMHARTPTHPQALCCFPPPEPWAKGALVEWVGAETEGTGTGVMESIKTACWVTSGKSFGWSLVISASQPLHTHIKVLCEAGELGYPGPCPLPRNAGRSQSQSHSLPMPCHTQQKLPPPPTAALLGASCSAPSLPTRIFSHPLH